MITLRAELEPRQESGNRRSSARRKLRLVVDGSSAAGSAEVLIRDLSTTGILLETGADLSPTDTIQLDLPLAGKRSAKIVWSSDGLFGCEFSRPISPGAVSAALLKTPFHVAPAIAPAEQAAVEAAPAPGSPASVKKLWSLIGASVALWTAIALVALLVLFR
jgi:hypothetical protein